MASQPTRPSEQQFPCPIPLNSFPLVDPMASHGDSSSQAQGDANRVATAKPALLYMPTQPTEDGWSHIFSAAKDAVALSGNAAIGSIGRVLGKRDIAESDDSYLFRVAIPGVAKEGFSCNVDPNGRVLITGVSVTGEKMVYRHSTEFEMQSQNLCPPGHFSISFYLPGPVNLQDVTYNFGVNAIFEGLVKKAKV